MIIKCGKDDKKRITEYIGDRFSECLYLYIDFLKYGSNSESIAVYTDVQEGRISCVMLNYHTGLHIFSRDIDFDIDGVIKKIREVNPSMICSVEKIISLLSERLNEYEPEYGYVCGIDEVKYAVKRRVEAASVDELKEVAEMLCREDSIGGSYEVEEMYRQLYERNTSKFGRNYIIRDNGKVVSHMSTGAEISNIAVLSGGVTSCQYKGMGFAPEIMAKMCTDLMNEGKSVYSFCYTQAAINMHKKVGFEFLHRWGKLTLKK